MSIPCSQIRKRLQCGRVFFYNPMNNQIISFDIREALISVIIGQHIDDVVSVF